MALHDIIWFSIAHSSIPTCQVSNAMHQPLSQFSHEEIKKNCIVASYAGEEGDNHGLPFFLGKVINVIDNSETPMVMSTRTTTRVTRHFNTWWKFMSTSKPKIMLANLKESTSCITSMERERKGFKSHEIQGGHFESPNRPKCFVDQSRR